MNNLKQYFSELADYYDNKAKYHRNMAILWLTLLIILIGCTITFIYWSLI